MLHILRYGRAFWHAPVREWPVFCITEQGQVGVIRNFDVSFIALDHPEKREALYWLFKNESFPMACVIALPDPMLLELG
jgi:hypothetical protein